MGHSETRNTRIVWHCRRSHSLTKAAVMTAILLSALTLTALHLVHTDSVARLDRLHGEIVSLAGQNRELRHRIETIDSLEHIRAVADEELDLVDPDTVIIEQFK